MGQVWNYRLEYRGTEIEVASGEVTVGRSKTCDITISDASVSRRHLILTATAGKLILKDLGSSNGTSINGNRIAGGGVLHNGDTLGLGDARLVAKLTQEVEEDPTAFATVRMPIQEAPGDATAFLQRASVELAKEALVEGQPPPPVEPAGVVFGVPAASEPEPEQPAASSVDQPPLDSELPGADPPQPPQPTGTEAEMPRAAQPPVPVAEVATPAMRSAPPVAAPAPRPTPPPVGPPRANPPSAETSPKDQSSADFESRTAPLETAGPGVKQAAEELVEPPTGDSRVPMPEEQGPKSSSVGELLPSLDDLDTSMFGRPSQETKEAQTLQRKLPPASFGVRFAALLFDALWAGGLSLSAGLLAGNFAATIASVVSSLVVITGWSLFGTTPGKRVLGLYVCTLDGRAGIGLGRSVARVLGYLVSAVPLGLGFARILWSKDRRGLHDLVSGTYVGRRRLG